MGLAFPEIQNVSGIYLSRVAMPFQPRRGVEPMATLQDIAKIAGVSSGLVSLALNGKPRVNPETAERIIRIANDLGYGRRAGRAGTAAGTGAVRLIRIAEGGSLLRTSHASFFADYIDGAERYSHECGYRFEVTSCNDYGELEKVLRTRQLRGAIVLATELPDADLQRLAGHSLPLVFLDVFHEHIPVDCCNMNNAGAVHAMLSTLKNLGHHDIGMVDSSVETFNFTCRAQAYEKFVDALGLKRRSGHVYRVHPEPVRAAEELTPLFKKRRPPSALLCMTDNLAHGCVQALASLGLRVPDDVSVMGFDDLPSSRVVDPPLATVRVPTREMGAAAARLLDNRIAHPERPIIKVLLDCEVVVRESIRAV